jgi:hypothetical protein
VINSQIRASYWMTFPLTIVNFNHFFIQPAPEIGGLGEATAPSPQQDQIRRAGKYSPTTQAGRLPQISQQRKRNHPLWISNVFFIYSNVICATQIMSVTFADTYINALINTSHRLSENIWLNSTARTQRTSRRTSRCWENVGESSSVCSMKFYLLKILNLV